MPINVREGTLGAILYHSHIIREADITTALEEQQRSGCRFGEALVALGIVTQEDIDWALSNQLDIPYIHLKQEMIDPDALPLIPARLCHMHLMIPLIRAGDELSIAIADPLDKAALTAAEATSGCRINLSVALAHEIREMLDRCYGSTSTDLLGFSSEQFSTDECDAINADLTGQQLLNQLLAYSIEHQPRAVSLRPFADRIAIVASNGTGCKELGILAPQHYSAVSGLIRTAAGIPHAAGPSVNAILHHRHHSQTVAFQILLMQGEAGDYLTIRRHRVSALPNRFEQLQLSALQHEQFRQLAGQQQGLILFASPSLQDRCRFMDLLLEEQDTSTKSVLALGSEPGRLSKQIPRIPLPEGDAARGRLITASLEHAPDILLIEDITTLEPFNAAVRAAMRGTLVLAGLEIGHTRQLLDFLIYQRRRSAALTSYLAGIVSLKSVQLLCPVCRQPVELSRREMADLQMQPPPPAFYRAAGCSHCALSGDGEQRFLTDCICLDDTLRYIFESSADGADFMAALQTGGYRGIDADGEALLHAGTIAPEEYIATLLS